MKGREIPGSGLAEPGAREGSRDPGHEFPDRSATILIEGSARGFRRGHGCQFPPAASMHHDERVLKAGKS